MCINSGHGRKKSIFFFFFCIGHVSRNKRKADQSCISNVQHLSLQLMSTVHERLIDVGQLPFFLYLRIGYLKKCTLALFPCLLNTSYLTDSYIIFTLQNGICIQKYHFWPKNDGEKWSGKNYFKIPPCGKLVIFITQLVILGTFMK